MWKPHSGYSGKLDKRNVEYVVCQFTNKRMNVSGNGREGNSFAFGTIWELDVVASTIQHLPDEVLREDVDKDGNKYQVVATDISVIKPGTGHHRPVFCIRTPTGPVHSFISPEEFRKA
jgi:hypothetical protein